MQGLTEGRIVHFVLPASRCFKNELQHRPAIVVNAWGNGRDASEEASAANLVVFVDGSNDVDPAEPFVMWKTSALYDAGGAPGTWHWPERE